MFELNPAGTNMEMNTFNLLFVYINGATSWHNGQQSVFLAHCSRDGSTLMQIRIKQLLKMNEWMDEYY